MGSCLALAGSYWNLLACPAALRATKKEIRSLCTAKVSVMPRAQQHSFSEMSNDHLPRPRGSWDRGLPLPAAGWRSSVRSQSHPASLPHFLMLLRKSLIPNKTSLLPLSRIWPTTLWPFECLWKMWTLGMESKSQVQGIPILSVLFLLAVSSSIIFFPWAFQGYCSCLAGNFCSLATSCHRSSTHTAAVGGGGMTPFFVPARRSVHGGSFWHRPEGWGNDLRLQFLQVMPGCSYISGKQEPAVPEQRTLLSAASTLKPSSDLIRDKFY